jgi:hypothetical protein
MVAICRFCSSGGRGRSAAKKEHQRLVPARRRSNDVLTPVNAEDDYERF